MAKLKPADVFQLARQAGFSDVEARTMTAIAGAESGYRTDAVGDLALVSAKWGPSVGLWQIRTLIAETGKGTPRDINRLKGSVLFQAQAARSVYLAQGYNAWTMYTNGGYRAFLGEAMGAATGVEREEATGGVSPVGAAVGAIGGGIVGTGEAALGAAGGVLSGIDAIGHFFASLSERSTWVRITQVLGGSGLIVAGLALLGKDIARPAISAAANLNPATAAVKAAADVADAAKG